MRTKSAMGSFHISLFLFVFRVLLGLGFVIVISNHSFSSGSAVSLAVLFAAHDGLLIEIFSFQEMTRLINMFLLCTVPYTPRHVFYC
ncbi:hypothetical protein BJ742DRAFT_801749, partial [Cladochytrium replicatum]